jgi:hypothetical protein
MTMRVALSTPKTPAVVISVPSLARKPNAATQDEKMFRVVRDRERWFQIIMGEQYDMDESATDRRAERVPLPIAVQQQLSMRLHPDSSGLYTLFGEAEMSGD